MGPNPVGWVKRDAVALKWVMAGTAFAGILVTLLAVEFSHGAFPGRNGRIAYVAPRDRVRSIATIRPDGTDRHFLTHGYDTDPAYSADGRRIAYVHWFGNPASPQPRFAIYVMRADGSHKERLTSRFGEAWSPHFSPDRTKIVFSRPVAGEDLWIMNSDGTHKQKLTHSPTVDDESPTFSPNGRRIAFASFRGDTGRIVVMHTDGSHPNRLGVGTNPDYSPSGHQIVFNRFRGQSEDIFVMRADGSHRQLLTPHSPNSNDEGAVFSPNGKRIAFHRARWRGNQIVNEVVVMRKRGANSHPVAHDWGDPELSWRPR